MRRALNTMRRGFQALAVALIASGFYLVLYGSGQIAADLTNIQLLSWLELFAGSMLTWMGAATLAQSKVIQGASLDSDGRLNEKWTRVNLNSSENPAKQD
jgi:hypothetical protein